MPGSVERDCQAHGHDDEGQGADSFQGAQQGIEAVGHLVVGLDPVHQQGIHDPHQGGGDDHQQPALPMGEPLPQGRGGGESGGGIHGHGLRDDPASVGGQVGTVFSAAWSG